MKLLETELIVWHKFPEEPLPETEFSEEYLFLCEGNGEHFVRGIYAHRGSTFENYEFNVLAWAEMPTGIQKTNNGAHIVDMSDIDGGRVECFKFGIGRADKVYIDCYDFEEDRFSSVLMNPAHARKLAIILNMLANECEEDDDAIC